MACCPPESAPYLVSNYVPNGTIKSVADVEFYQAEPIGAVIGGVIIFPDWYGWNSGNTRKVADYLSNVGFRVIVPKLLCPPIEGGTDGDGVPSDFDTKNRMGEAFGLLKSITWDKIHHKVLGLIDYLKSGGITKIGALGFCWGGWAAVQASVSSVDINCMVSAHPSIQVEGAHGGDPAALVSKIQAPLLLLPAGGDPDIYRPGGGIYEAVKSKYPDKEIYVDFPDMVHGWVPRGDTSDPVVKAAIEKALLLTVNFLKSEMNV